MRGIWLVWISVLRIRVSSGLVRGDGLCRVKLRDGCERGFGNRGDVRLLIISLLSRGVGVLWSGAKNRG